MNLVIPAVGNTINCRASDRWPWLEILSFKQVAISRSLGKHPIGQEFEIWRSLKLEGSSSLIFHPLSLFFLSFSSLTYLPAISEGRRSLTGNVIQSSWAGILPRVYHLGKNTEVGCHFPLQGIFQTQRSNTCLLCLLLWQAGSLALAPPGKPISLHSTYKETVFPKPKTGMHNLLKNKCLWGH